jgi:bifunctional non-homologous end joining protein LigD
MFAAIRRASSLPPSAALGNVPQAAPRAFFFVTPRCSADCIDGEAIVVDERGLSAFDLLRSWRHDHAAVLCAFDLIELDGKDLRRVPIEQRKQALAGLLHPERDGLVLNVQYDCDGATVFKHACALGCEGIVSKRLGSPYRSGRVEHWLKIKNPAAPALKREAEEDWVNKRWSHAPR